MHRPSSTSTRDDRAASEKQPPPKERRRGTFDTKIVIVIRDDLAPWQELNVTAFLTSGIVGANQGLLWEPLRRRRGQQIQPARHSADDRAECGRRSDKDDLPAGDGTWPAALALTEEMVATGHDGANRAAVKQHLPETLIVVGLALRYDK